MSIVDQMLAPDMFRRAKERGVCLWDTGAFIGRPFRLDYASAQILVCDYWKEKARGLPQGCFLLAYYDCDPDKKDLEEALLLRVRMPVSLPLERDYVGSMIEYYKQNLKTGSYSASTLDQLTRYELSFSGMECAILGCFYMEGGKLEFGTDVENFYSAHNYSVIKPAPEILKRIVNYGDSGSTPAAHSFNIGWVRYSSSRRFQRSQPDVPVFVKAADFAGKRTGLFGMTRTGKSNTVKKIIQAVESISFRARFRLDADNERPDEMGQPLDKDGFPKYPVGQIIFDMNGEYANPNLQDGVAISEMFSDKTERYAVREKAGFKVLKFNFYSDEDHEEAFELLVSSDALKSQTSQYVTAFLNVNLAFPPEDADVSEKRRFERRLAVYRCILHRAGFEAPKGFRVKFAAAKEVCELVYPLMDPSRGLSLDEACAWWDSFWDKYDDKVFKDYAAKKKKEWASDDLKHLLVMLTGKSGPGKKANLTAIKLLKALKSLHTHTVQNSFITEIITHLRKGGIVIIDLSSGSEEIQNLYSEKISRAIFADGMERFTSALPNNFIQFYFEEAHNLFPKKEDKNLSQIYNRLAKEGAKLNIGLVYATQEVSSISSNILKNTQNWFISHLNNQEEIKELKKYYDFGDFSDSLIRFSQATDKGFARVKTFSNPFVVPMQVALFAREGG